MEYLNLDRIVVLIGSLQCAALLAARWASYTGSMKGSVLLVLLANLSVLILSVFSGNQTYQFWRIPLILCMRAFLLLVRVDGQRIAHLQVRLYETPSGAPQDLVKAFMGLRFGNLVLAGFMPMRWSIWLLQQLVVLMLSLNLDHDCATPLLTHPTVVSRIERFHAVMLVMCKPILAEGAQAGVLYPATELGRCKAAVSFWGLLLALLLPALLLVKPPSSARPPPPPRCILGKMDRQIERGLQALRFWGRRQLWEVAARWWVLLVLAWAATTAPFS